MNAGRAAPMPGLTMKSLGKHPSLIPLLGAIGFGALVAGGYLFRLATRNPDCSWDRKNNQHPWQKMTPHDQYKFYSVKIDYKKNEFPPERPDI